MCVVTLRYVTCVSLFTCVADNTIIVPNTHNVRTDRAVDTNPVRVHRVMMEK